MADEATEKQPLRPVAEGVINYVVLVRVFDEKITGLAFRVDSMHLGKSDEASARMMELCRAGKSAFVEPIRPGQHFLRTYKVVE
jgi:hypothetical protein